MPLFEYTALDSTGEKTAGTLSAATRPAALEQVLSKGFTPVSVSEHQPTRGRKLVLFDRVRGRQVEAFTRELSHLLAGGVPMSRALAILCREAATPAARRQWTSIHEDVTGGLPLGDALRKWPASFPPVYVAMVRAGEAGGFLDVVLSQIADLLERERDLKGRVRSALAYPTVIAVLAAGVLVFLLAYFIPQFSLIFADFGESLPALTQWIIAVSDAVTQYGLLVLGILAAAVILIRRALKTERGRRVAERVILRCPGIGTAVARFALVRFSRMLGTLLAAGVALITSLRVSREAIGNQTLADAVNDAIEQVRQGKPLARSLAACPRLFPPSVVEMIAVAEESGQLDSELMRLAETYEQDLNRRLRTLVAMAEPLMLFITAALVGTIVIGMLLPVFTLQEMIQ